MLHYLLMLCLPILNCCQSISQKQYNLKYGKPNVILFSAVTSVIALCFFLITSGFRLDFTPALLPYSLAFAVAYASAWVATVLALRYGLMALSSLIGSFSLVFPIVYGIILGESITPAIIVGLALLFAALILVNLKSDKNSRFSVKWLICVAISLVGNGVCSISQLAQNRALGDSYTHEFMIIALVAASILLFAYAVFTSKNLLADFKACVPFALANGTANGLINFLILVIITRIPATIFYPTNSALCMIATFLLAFLLYKERFSNPQYIGYALGVASIVLLNM